MESTECAIWEEIDYDLSNIDATFGLRILQIGVTHCAESIEDRWKLANDSDTYEYITKAPQELLADLDNGNYIRYSSIIIILNRVELTDRTEVKMLLKGIKNNRYLRHTPIFVIFEYGIEADDTGTMDSYLNKIRGKYPNTDTLERHDVVFPNNFSQYTADWDSNYFQSCEMENVMLMQIFELYEWYDYAYCLDTIRSQQDLTASEALSGCVNDFQYILIPSSEEQMYFFNMNPTMAIVINNYHFTSPMTIRRGSEQDVAHLIREFKLDKIPYIVVEDSGCEELMAVLKFMQTTNFSMLKRLMVFVMSHGERNHTIYTHDGTLNSNADIVQLLLSNSSLANVTKSIVFVYCRGETDLAFEEVTPELLESFKPADSKHLDANTVVLYSTLDTLASFRWPRSGTPAILSFCKNYRRLSLSDTMDTLWQNMEKDIKKIDLYEDLSKCTELVGCNAGISESVKTMRSAAADMMQLIHNFILHFPTNRGSYIMAGGLYNIATSLNESKFPKTIIARLYISPELDNDTSSADDDACLKLTELQEE